MTDSKYSSYSYLDVTVKDGIAVIVINRPEKMNACGRPEHTELSTILRVIQDDDDVRVAVITGAGKAFSVGGDLDFLDEMHADTRLTVDVLKEAREIVQAHIAFEKPIVCAINGVAMGAGLAFALLCDYIIVERHAQLADGHIRAALASGDGGALVWPLTVGLTKAKRYLMTGDSIGAEEAERLGLVSEVVDQGRSLDRAMFVARRFAAGPQLAIRYTKMALNQWLRQGQLTAFDYSYALEQLTFADDEVATAVKGLRERRESAIPPDSADW